MSDFFRIHAPPEHARLTLRQLAVMVHDAEDSADDVTLVECFDELERRKAETERPWVVMDLFMEFYRSVWHDRMTSKPTDRDDADPQEGD